MTKPYHTNEAYVTYKDHKDDWVNNPQVRLINPSKSDIGKISKTILDRVTKIIRVNENLPQWKSTINVLNWFELIQEKHKRKFVKFDIVSYYPSITEDLLARTIQWAREITDITELEIAVIRNARKTFIFNEEEAWIKNDSNEEKGPFDCSMGAFDSAECSDLVGLFMLEKLVKITGHGNGGLYRDDALLALKGSGPQIEQIKKKIIQLFKSNGLAIEMGNTSTKTEFLDIMLDLGKQTYEPYNKPNHKIKYIDSRSNHPAIIKKNLPKMIEKRISLLSSNESIFDKHKSVYEKALKEAGFKDGKIKYQKPNGSITSEASKKSKRNRTRDVVWFTPPYSENVATKIGGTFFYLLQKHFPKESSKYYRLFNKL